MRKFILLTVAVLFSFAAFSQDPTPGSTCADAIALTLGTQVSGSTQDTCPASLQTIDSYTYRCGYTFYKFTPATDMSVKITISGISRVYNPEATSLANAANVGMYLYNICPTEEGATAMGQFVSASRTATSGTINTALTAETEYYIAILTDSLISQGFMGLGAAASYTTANFNLVIEQVLAKDITVSAISADAAGCSDMTTVNYTVKNLGQEAITAATVALYVNGAEDATATFTISDTTINSGASYAGTFTGVALIEGANTIKVVATLEADENDTNNEAETNITRSSIINTFPMTDNFEGETNNWIVSVENAWRVIEDAENANKYFASDTAVSMTSMLTTPCLDFSSLEIPTMRFDFKANYSAIISELSMFEALLPTMGINLSDYTASTRLQASIDGGATWDSVASYSESIEEFETMNIDLSRYAGQSSVIIRFNYADRIPGLANLAGGFIDINVSKGSGIALDNIIIKDAPQKDLGILAITEPLSGCGLSSATVKVQIKNFGRSAQNSYSVAYSTDNGTTWSTPEAVTTSIAAGATIDYTFTTPLDLSEVGQYNLQAKVILADDEEASNDIAETVVVSQDLYTEADVSFDEVLAGNQVNDWYAEGTNSSWEFGSIEVDENELGVWATNLDGSANPNEVSYLYSPCYDLSGMTNPIMKINLRYELSSMDLGDAEGGEIPINPGDMFSMFGGKLSVEYTTNGGGYWVTVMAGTLNEGWYSASAIGGEEISGPGWSSNSTGIIAVKTSLDDVQNNPQAFTNVKFRFAFQTSSLGGGEEIPFNPIDFIGGFTGGGGLGGVAVNSFSIYNCGQPIPEAGFTYENEACTGTVVFTNTSTEGETYAWNFGDGAGLNLGELGDGGFDINDLFGDNSTTSTEENPTMYYQNEGTYNVILSATNQCGTSVFQDSITIDFCTTLIESEEGNLISVYPNPASNMITIANAEGANIEICNALGQVVMARENISSNYVLDLSALSNGTYFVKVNANMYKISVVR